MRRLAVTSVAGMLVAAVPLLLAQACGGDSGGASTPPPLPTGTSMPTSTAPQTDAAPPAPQDAATPFEGGTPARRFVGSRASSATTPFGGSPYCNYTITLKQIAIDITVNSAGLATAATETDTSAEADVPPCPNPAAPPSNNQYSLMTSSKLANGVLHMELAASTTNHPIASLVLEGTFDSDHPTVTGVWHRTDLGKPLDWQVTTTVPLDLR